MMAEAKAVLAVLTKQQASRYMQRFLVELTGFMAIFYINSIWRKATQSWIFEEQSTKEMAEDSDLNSVSYWWEMYFSGRVLDQCAQYLSFSPGTKNVFCNDQIEGALNLVTWAIILAFIVTIPSSFACRKFNCLFNISIFPFVKLGEYSHNLLPSVAKRSKLVNIKVPRLGCGPQ